MVFVFCMAHVVTCRQRVPQVCVEMEHVGIKAVNGYVLQRSVFAASTAARGQAPPNLMPLVELVGRCQTVSNRTEHDASYVSNVPGATARLMVGFRVRQV